MLVGLGIFLWSSTQLPSVDVEQALRDVNFLQGDNPPSKESLEEEFARLKHPVTIPTEELNLEYLVSWGLRKNSPIDGLPVPELVFVRPGGRSNRLEKAQVYLLSDKRFDLRSLKRPSHDPGYRVQVTVRKEGNGQAMIIFFNGDNIDWLKPQLHKANPNDPGPGAL